MVVNLRFLKLEDCFTNTKLLTGDGSDGLRYQWPNKTGAFLHDILTIKFSAFNES